MVDDVSVVRFPRQLIYVMLLFNQILLKNDWQWHNDQSANACQSFRINVKAVKVLGQILRLIYFSEK